MSERGDRPRRSADQRAGVSLRRTGGRRSRRPSVIRRPVAPARAAPGIVATVSRGRFGAHAGDRRRGWGWNCRIRAAGGRLGRTRVCTRPPLRGTFRWGPGFAARRERAWRRESADHRRRFGGEPNPFSREAAHAPGQRRRNHDPQHGGDRPEKGPAGHRTQGPWRRNRITHGQGSDRLGPATTRRRAGR
jgi:hypothetical protein